MKIAIVLGALLLVSVSPAFADSLACQDEYERSRNLSRNLMDNPDSVPEAVQAASDSYDCLADYESKHGKEAREDLDAKLRALEPQTE